MSSSEFLEAAGPWLHSDLGMLPLRPSRETVLTEVILFRILCYGSPGKSTPPPSNSLRAWLKIRNVLTKVQAVECTNEGSQRCNEEERKGGLPVGCSCGRQLASTGWHPLHSMCGACLRITLLEGKFACTYSPCPSSL